jgi:hypothetical protein
MVLRDPQHPPSFSYRLGGESSYPRMLRSHPYYTDKYWDLHRRLEFEGKIKHSREQCPDRNGPRVVRAWDPKDGWREIRPGFK